MDALHKQRLISANMATFLSNVNADLSRHDTMDQLRTGWLKYLKYDSTRASAGLVVPSSVESRFRRSLPISENADGGQNSPEAAVGPVPSRSFLEILWVELKMKTNSTLQLYNVLSCNGF